jgi:hypothetical protein
MSRPYGPVLPPDRAVARHHPEENRVTAISNLLSAADRERILERLAELRDLNAVMTEPPRPSERAQHDDTTDTTARSTT